MNQNKIDEESKEESQKVVNDNISLECDLQEDEVIELS